MTASAAGKKRRSGGSKSHATYWPPVRRLKERSHIITALTLAGPQQRNIVSGNRAVIGHASSYTEFKAVCKSFQSGIDCYVGNLMDPRTGFPWLDDAIADPEAQVICAKNEGVTCIIIRQGNRWTTVTSLSRWFPEWQEMDVSTMLKHIKAVCVDVGVGIQSSPGALGAALMHKRWNEKKVTRPPNGCRKAMLDNLVGGRVEFPREAKRLPEVVELDLRSAYASCSYDLPVGTTVYVPDSDTHGGDFLCDRFPSWYARCTVDVRTSLRLGIFPVQNAGNELHAAKWIFPKGAGTYEAWLWREEWLDCIAAGCQVTVHEAYAWEHISNGLQPWVDEMEALRYAYEANEEPVRASMVKRAIVAAIGRFGIAPEKRTLVSRAAARKGDTPLVYQKSPVPFSDRWIHVEHEENCEAPIHWHSHILMLCRRKLYYRGLEELEDGNELIGQNFDALYLARPSKRPTGKGIGEWKSVTLTPAQGEETVNLPFSRAVVAHQKVLLPGVPRSKRQQLGYIQ